MNNGTEQLYLLSSIQTQPPGQVQKQDAMQNATPRNLENVQDFSNVCRICATITQLVVPIFAGEGLEHQLADKIHKHLPVKVAETDQLPLVVCYQCVSTLMAWHELVECSVQADRALKAKIGMTSRTEDVKRESHSTTPAANMKTEEDSQNKAYVAVKIERSNTDISKKVVDSPPISAVAPDGRRTAWCDICNKSVSVVSWRRHQRLHNGEKRYSCHTCGRAFADSGNLARHVKTLHAQQRPFSCSICLKTFSRKAHLDDHLRSHSDRREFVCDVCGKASKSSAALRMHLRTHGAPGLRCVQCGAAFRRAAELRAHRSVHSGERAHRCSCGRAFRLRTQLNSHARTHAARTPELNNVTNCVPAQPTEPQPIRVPPKYTPPCQLCEFCNTTYPEETFVKHLLVEHYQMLFHCFQCDKYINKMQYGTHMARHAEQRAMQRQFDVTMNWTSFARPSYNILLPITFNRYTYASAQVNNDQNINRTVLVTSNQSIDTTAPITHNEEIKIVAAVSPCQNANIAVTPHDNFDTTIAVTSNQDLNNATASAKCDNTQQDVGLTAPMISNVNTDTSALVTGNKNMNTIVLRSRSMYERMTLTSITSQVTRNRGNNVEALARSQKSNTTPITIKPDTTSIGSGGRTTKQASNNQENEFSDHSDMEYGFGPLPESVFEAIEDTQDSQSAEDSNQIADIEHVSDDATPATIDSSCKQPASKKTRKCPICSKVYHASSSYFYHLKHTHKRVKDHECKICTKKFATRASLAAHTPTHTGECQFECKHCKKRFRSNASLYIHEQTHNGIKRFSCQQCDTSFRWKTHLLRHIKRHAAEKSHVCTTCGRGFSIRCDLLRHMRTHSAGEYACGECDVKFAQMRYLKVHMEKKHSKNAVKKLK